MVPVTATKRDIAQKAAAEHGGPEVIVAVIFDGDAVYDLAFGWEAAQSMVLNDGYTAIATADDGERMTVDRAQALYDSERALFRDCWGVS